MPTTSTGSAQRGRRRSAPKQSSSSTSSTTKASAQTRSSAKSPTRSSTTQQSSGASIPVPYVTAQLHTTKIPLPAISLPEIPGREGVASTVVAVRDALPSRDQLLFYSGLTAAAALSVIEWPVAAAIGIGAAVMQRNASRSNEQA